MNRNDINIGEIWGKETNVQKDRKVLFRNRKWFADNIDSIYSKYKGKVVAIYDEKVVLVGASAEELWEDLKDKYPIDAVMVMLVPNEEPYILPYPGEKVTE